MPTQTLHLSGQITVTDPTDTTVTVATMTAALELMAKRPYPAPIHVQVLGIPTAMRDDPVATGWVLEGTTLVPTESPATATYTLEYSSYRVQDPHRAGNSSAVALHQLSTVLQSAADRTGLDTTLVSDLPGIRTLTASPAAPDTVTSGHLAADTDTSEDPGHPATVTGQMATPAAMVTDTATVSVSTAEAFATRKQARTAASAPAQEGWRGALNRVLGTKLAPGQQEESTRTLRATVQHGLAGHRTAVVVNIKGGASKTTSTYLLSATLGRVRGGMILAWDNNENSGNLADRALPAAHSHTALDLLEHIEDFTTPEHADRLAGFIRPQGENRFHVLASQNEAGDKEVINAAAFRTMHAALRQFYGLAIVDTGNASTAPTWQAAVDVADVLVIAISNREDAARRAFTTIDALRRQGYGDKLTNAVALITQPSNPNATRLAEIEQTLAGHIRATVTIPFDPALEDGGEIIWEALNPRTQHAYLRATAAVIEGM